MIFQKNSTILWNKQVSDNYFQMGLQCHGLSKAIPGQFVMIQLSDNPYPLLRRPFSIYGLIDTKDTQGIELLYKVVGKGTSELSTFPVGRSINVLGPLGNGFDLTEPIKSAILISGGIGVAPMVFLGKRLLESDIYCRALTGGKTATDLLCTDVFNHMCIEMLSYTDDASAGKQGFVTDGLLGLIDQEKPDIIYACGPYPMLKKVSEIAKKYGIACRISIESHMACGMGACLGCAVLSKDSHKNYFHVCTDGPVFDACRVF